MKALSAKTQDAKLKALWQNLADGRAFVDKHGRVPRIGWAKTEQLEKNPTREQIGPPDPGDAVVKTLEQFFGS